MSKSDSRSDSLPLRVHPESVDSSLPLSASRLVGSCSLACYFLPCSQDSLEFPKPDNQRPEQSICKVSAGPEIVREKLVSGEEASNRVPGCLVCTVERLKLGEGESYYQSDAQRSQKPL